MDLWVELSRDLGLFPSFIELFSDDLEQSTRDVVQSVYFSVQMGLWINLKSSIPERCFQGIV